MKSFPTVTDLPEVDTQAMIEVDRLMMEDYGISLFQMMENAGRCLAILARDLVLAGDPRGRRVTVLSGAGGNGGGALTAGRRLAGWGADVTVALAQPADVMADTPRAQLRILEKLRNVEIIAQNEMPEPSDVILDGLIGYSLKGNPNGRAAALIDWANGRADPTLALDVPSGFDASTGTLHFPAVQAAATLTIALPKAGLTSPSIANNVGRLFCADISVPPELYRDLPDPLEVRPFFAQNDIVEIQVG